MNRTQKMTLSASSLLLATAGAAMALPVSVQYFDTPGCDDHGPQIAIEELGTDPTVCPMDEFIDATSTTVSFPACPPMDNGTPSALVIMTNLSGRDWTDLYYVGDPETVLTNVDGQAFSNAAPGVVGNAFRIDMLGVNRSLVAESFANDGIFQAGETWEFLIQNYAHPAGLPAHALGSPDFAGASLNFPQSSGSIIAMVPAPGTLALAGFSGIAVFRRRRH